MKNIFLRFLFLALLVVVQMSFLSVFFPRLDIPVLPLLAIVAWTLHVGFPRSLWMTVPLTVLFDLAVSGALTFFSLYGVFLAYTASFVSRRLLIEGGGLGTLLTLLFAMGGVMAYQGLGWLGWHFLPPATALADLWAVGKQTLSQFLVALILSVLLFPLVSFSVRIFEERLRLSSQTSSIK